jgi:poly(ADP-ribose) glycohydrolase
MPCIQWFIIFIFVVIAAPDGVVTYARRYVSHSNLPQWDRSQKLLTKLHITSQGNIEDDGGGLLQVDFANKCVYHAICCLS